MENSGIKDPNQQPKKSKAGMTEVFIETFKDSGKYNTFYKFHTEISTFETTEIEAEAKKQFKIQGWCVIEVKAGKCWNKWLTNIK